MPNLSSNAQSLSQLEDHESFVRRHIGPDADQINLMLKSLGLNSLDELIQETVPSNILSQQTIAIAPPQSEQQALNKLRQYADQNQVFNSFIGLGYANTIMPSVIQRNVLENPGWYTAYTPYQPEISQGRLEALLNYQQMVTDLSGMELANASLLDEATAAAEAMTMAKRVVRKNKSNMFFIADDCHPQTIAVMKTRALHMGIDIKIGNLEALSQTEVYGALLQYPGTHGDIHDLEPIVKHLKEKEAICVVASDLLALTQLKPPGEFGADIVIGNSQRFGVPLGYGGPHAAFFATRDQYKRSIPGRIIGVSVDRHNNLALRMAMQTREQHIRREKATSNICTAQALLAILASFYAVYHGPKGLDRIAKRVHTLSKALAQGLAELGFTRTNKHYFDTLTIELGEQQNALIDACAANDINVRINNDNSIGISLDETTTRSHINALLALFSQLKDSNSHSTTYELELIEQNIEQLASQESNAIPNYAERYSSYLTHPVFNRYHSETDMLRYMRQLEVKDIALNHSMIPLGSCTMKLNASSEMLPISWPEFNAVHPFAPHDQTLGYQSMLVELEQMLASITGYDSVSLQPNSGAQGEYAGLLAIKRYHESRGDQRDICLIPKSAHGTNPASAAMANMRIVLIACDDNGNIDMDDLNIKVKQHSHELAAIMVTYPSTHGVFEESITDVCELIHEHGGQVYLDGANMNAMVGIAAPGEFGADVSHLNLHKTFAIPHGGGGPGIGPIGVKAHLAPFLPSHPLMPVHDLPIENDTISAAPFGSASILPISWMYISMMGASGLRRATQIAILNANYIAKRLSEYYPILYTGRNQKVAHECIIDLRPIKSASGISEEDIAKRLMDYGFHAPTMSFPVAGTLMIEPTESESLYELDRFCEAMITIRKEIQSVENGQLPSDDNPLVNAPHTAQHVCGDHWPHVYSREQAAYPVNHLKNAKYWPAVARIDNVYGDRNLFCSCPELEAYENENITVK